MFGFGKKKVALAAPFSGTVVPVEEVPDPMFSGKMLGDGFAVKPSDDAHELTVTAPADGKLLKVFKTGHAFAMVTSEGLELLVHIGLETVEMKGEGFTVLAENGQEVTAGTPVVKVDLDAVHAAGRDPITIVVLTKKGQVSEVSVHSGASSSKPAAEVTLA